MAPQQRGRQTRVRQAAALIEATTQANAMYLTENDGIEASSRRPMVNKSSIFTRTSLMAKVSSNDLNAHAWLRRKRKSMQYLLA